MKNAQEQALTRWLASHHGVITVKEAQRLGIRPDTIRQLAGAGRLARRHEGVYAERATSPQTPSGWLMDAAAALAATGGAGALALCSAAWLWGWLDEPPWPVDIVLPFRGTSRLQRVRVHRTRIAPPTRSQQGLRLTDPVRTLLDLAGDSPQLLTSIVDRAVASNLFRFADLQTATQTASKTATKAATNTPTEASAQKARRRPGVAVLRRHLEWQGYLGAPSPSVLESMMARIFLHFGLPLPLVEVVPDADGRYRVDFAYPALMLAIEVKGYAWHSQASQLDHDDRRRNELELRGWTVLEFSWRMVVDDPASVAAQILAAYHRLAA
jgi:predicted transcriptional regulator of viral defense system